MKPKKYPKAKTLLSKWKAMAGLVLFLISYLVMLKASTANKSSIIALDTSDNLFVPRAHKNANEEDNPQRSIMERTQSTESENDNKQQYYDPTQIVKLSPILDQAPQTIVTAYFRIPSKHSSDSYQQWMQHMLSLRDPMVIFLSKELIPEISQLRQHAKNRTVLIPMRLEDVPLAQHYNTSFWEHQLEIDPEARIHRGYHVFWIWLSKSWWVTQAVGLNYFYSQVFVWSDMGCFRNARYDQQEMVLHYKNQIPRNRILHLAHHPIVPSLELVWNNKYSPQTKHHFYHSGSMMAGYGDVWLEFHQAFLTTMQEFLDRDMFIGEDQTVLQSTCRLRPDLCAYVPPSQLKRKDNHYFGLRYLLHYGGGNYTLWTPPPVDATPAEIANSAMK